MTIDTETKLSTLGDWGARAIKKHFEKILKHEAGVLNDSNPEELHQMRVGMRRLRSAITGFAPALDLPKQVQEKKIGKIAHTLGALRDFDVLGAALEKEYKPSLPSKEQKLIETALVDLKKQRRKALGEVKKTLEGDRYQSIKQSVKKWLKQPTYQEIAQMPIQEVLPDLLLPEVSKLLLHPGWLVGTEVKDGAIYIIKDLLPEIVDQQLADKGAVLHELRKETKRARYQMEVFEEFYGSSYQAYLQDVKDIQAILGQMQDRVVLTDFVVDILESEVKSVLPTLAEQLANTSYRAWQKWQTLQQRYLNLEIRRGFHSAILQPNISIMAISN